MASAFGASWAIVYLKQRRGFEGDSAVVVYAVAHQQRRPGYWKDRP